MKIAAAIITAILALVGTVSAWNEPDSFREVPWGASVKEAQAILGASATCRPALCSQTALIGRAAVTFLYSFREDHFVFAHLEFKAGDYEMLKAIFVEKYGPPTQTDQSEFISQGGASGVNEILQWDGDRVVMSLQKVEGRIDTGGAQVMLAEEAKRRDQELQRAIKKAIEDLWPWPLDP